MCFIVLKRYLVSPLWFILDYVQHQTQFYSILQWRNAQRQSGTRHCAQHRGVRASQRFMNESRKRRVNPSRLSVTHTSRIKVTKSMMQNRPGLRGARWSRARPPRRTHGTFHSAASCSFIRHRSFLDQMNGLAPNFHALRPTEEPCARDGPSVEIDARFPFKPVASRRHLICLTDLRGSPGLDPVVWHRERTRVTVCPVPCCSRTSTNMPAQKIRWNTANWWFSGEWCAFTTAAPRFTMMMWVCYNIVGGKRICYNVSTLLHLD